MIFISHNHKDKVIVENIAIKLASIFGTDKVFYDSWSIQPGDGIIDKMNQGLLNCKFFFFFVSQNSLQSKMVDLEWQNALLKATQGNAKFIPVKLDACLMPPILMQTMYIDIFGKGLEVGFRQMIDIIRGHNAFIPIGPQEFQNVRAYANTTGNIVTVTTKAEYYLEPISSYVFLVENDENELNFQVTSEKPPFTVGYEKNLQITNGQVFNCFWATVQRGTVPGFPFVVKITPNTDKPVKLAGVMRAISTDKYEMIPLIIN